MAHAHIADGGNQALPYWIIREDEHWNSGFHSFVKHALLPFQRYVSTDTINVHFSSLSSKNIRWLSDAQVRALSIDTITNTAKPILENLNSNQMRRCFTLEQYRAYAAICGLNNPDRLPEQLRGFTDTIRLTEQLISTIVPATVRCISAETILALRNYDNVDLYDRILSFNTDVIEAFDLGQLIAFVATVSQHMRFPLNDQEKKLLALACQCITDVRTLQFLLPLLKYEYDGTSPYRRNEHLLMPVELIQVLTPEMIPHIEPLRIFDLLHENNPLESLRSFTAEQIASFSQEQAHAFIQAYSSLKENGWCELEEQDIQLLSLVCEHISYASTPGIYEPGFSSACENFYQVHPDIVGRCFNQRQRSGYLRFLHARYEYFCSLRFTAPEIDLNIDKTDLEVKTTIERLLTKRKEYYDKHVRPIVHDIYTRYQHSLPVVMDLVSECEILYSPLDCCDYFDRELQQRPFFKELEAFAESLNTDVFQVDYTRFTAEELLIYLRDILWHTGSAKIEVIADLTNTLFNDLTYTSEDNIDALLKLEYLYKRLLQLSSEQQETFVDKLHPQVASNLLKINYRPEHLKGLRIWSSYKLGPKPPALKGCPLITDRNFLRLLHKINAL